MSRPRLGGFQALLSSIAILVIAAWSVGHAPAQTGGPTTVKLAEKGRGAEVSLEMPQRVFDDPRLAARLVKEGAEEMLKFRQEAEKALEELGPNPEFWHDWTLSILWKETLRTARFLSLLKTAETYTGGAHGNAAFSTVNYDRRSGRDLGLGDFFGKLSDGAEVLKKIAAFVQREIAVQQGEFADKNWIAEGAAPKVDAYSVFTLAPAQDGGAIGGMTFHFAPYIVGPYAAGDFHITVPQRIFASYLKSDLRALFAGEPKPWAATP